MVRKRANILQESQSGDESPHSEAIRKQSASDKMIAAKEAAILEGMKCREADMKRYAIVVEKAKRNYAAYVPDLPGCVATGPTLKATEKLLREAIEAHVQALIEDGQPVPEPSSLV